MGEKFAELRTIRATIPDKSDKFDNRKFLKTMQHTEDKCFRVSVAQRIHFTVSFTVILPTSKVIDICCAWY